MSRFSRLSVIAVGLVMAVACGRTARIDAVVENAGTTDVIVKLLDVNRFSVMDTVRTDEAGAFSYKVNLQEGQPEFVYLFHGERKIASMILHAGDRVSVVADTLGNYTVEGSEESVRLAQVERDHARAVAGMDILMQEMEATSDASLQAALRQTMGKKYIEYYRDRVRYVMENCRSLSVVPVFYQTLGANLPVFGQQTDAIHFKNIADSLAILYPDSKYVKTLRQEAEKRFSYLELENRLASAEPVGFPDMELSDIQGKKRRLSEVGSKVVMVHFWTATDAEQKMFNLDVLKPLYAEFHDKGFEIYQVSLDIDKGLWAQVVKEQKHPWISVCDSRGTASPVASSYNLQSLPSVYVISDGTLVDIQAADEKYLRKLLNGLLK